MSRTRIKQQIPEPLKAAYRIAIAEKWTVTFTRGNHLKWSPPDGMPVFTPSTPNGGRRATENTLALLRRAGLPC